MKELVRCNECKHGHFKGVDCRGCLLSKNVIIKKEKKLILIDDLHLCGHCGEFFNNAKSKICVYCGGRN